MICTFYSFKGGVGRSMALANVAEAFHERGLRVLVVDWDLEAPGVEAFFTPSIQRGSEEAAPSLEHPGLVDLLLEYQSQYSKLQASRAAALAVAAAPDSVQYAREIQRGTALADKVLRELDDLPDFLREPPQQQSVPLDFVEFVRWVYEDGKSPSRYLPPVLAHSPLRNFLQCIHAPDPERQNGLYLLSAGARADAQFTTYAEAVQEFDWTEFYVSYEGAAYFSWLRTELSALADIVLIDSRTGVTEMGGVCTRHLPDVVVSFCAPNYQNVNGVLRVMSGVNKEDVRKARGDRHVDVLIIPTRIDLTESDRLQRFSEDFARKVEDSSLIPEEFKDLPRPLWNLQIPYIPRYNYQEQRVLGPDVPPADEAGEKLAYPYRRLALHLAVLGDLERDAGLRAAFAGAIAMEFPHLMGGVPDMTPPVTAHFIGREAELEELAAYMLRPSTDPDSFIVVAGPPGIGKSALVARACRDLGSTAFPDGLLWAKAADVATAVQALEWLTRSFGEKQIGERALREKLKDRRFFIAVDDVAAISDVRHVFSYGARCTRVVITRELALVAGASGPRIVMGPFPHQASQTFLPAEQLLRAGEADDVLAAFLRWPLGASLARVELERRQTLGQTVEAAAQEMRAAFSRHGIVAFDQPGVDRSTSVARTLRDVVYGGSLAPQARQLLVSIARSKEGAVLPADVSSAAHESSPIVRLTNLGLVTRDAASGRVVAHPLIRDFLIREGEFDDRPAGEGTRERISAKDSVDVERAKAILRGQSAALDEIQRLGDTLKDGRYFGYARQLFALARRHPEFRIMPAKQQLKIAQRFALCTYKDNDLPADDRFGAALHILGDADLNAATPSQETLGLAGAVYKNMWRLSGRRRDLEHAAALYERGSVQGVDGDFGYTGINAAFVHDLIAAQQRQEAPDEAETHSAEARQIRTAIVAALPRLASDKQNEWLRGEWWFYATVAEACFGLNRQDEARYWLREGLPTKPPDWHLESTTRQLAELAYAQGQPMTPDSNACRTLGVLVGHAGDALRAVTLGKFGLALSGGGFRASLFHIGVLARLAEADLLRHVEVLSCVSGGSIVGAHYYLEVRRLLSEKGDREITRGDYVEIVQRIETQFLEAVQRNLRTRLFVSVIANLRTLVDPDYTRTDYLGRLFERHIYSRVNDDGRRYLNELVITPPDLQRFNPRLDNWRRGAKGPVLLLNATTLNTGHNWQFAVSWMGEPALGASSPVDRNNVLRRVYYSEAPDRYKQVSLGRAVAASACVPGLFDPVAMDGLYPNQIVRLVDGGVHDNQGITGLLEQECTFVVVSDASGQTNLVPRPSGEVLSVPMRANSILMGRVREAEFRELDLLRRSGAIRGLMFLHLKKDLDVAQVNWVDSQEPASPIEDAPTPNTSYGMPKTVQRLLAGIRTDLDSFTDREAYALMLSGYEMAATELRTALPESFEVGGPGQWRFKTIEPAAKRATGQDLAHAELLRHLQVGSSRGGKLWKLSGPLAATARIAGLVILAAAVVFPRNWVPLVPVRAILGVASVYAAIAAILWLGHRVARSGKSFTVIATGLVMVPFGALAAFVHLALFDLLFLFKGSVGHSVGHSQPVRRAFYRRVTIAVLALLVVSAALLWGLLSRGSRNPEFRGVTASRSPSVPVEVLNSARSAQTSREYDTAIALWTEVLAADPKHTEALSSRAYDYMQRGELEAATADYTAALNVRPNEPDWLRARAYLYKLLDRLDESRSDLTTLLSLGRDEATLDDIRYLDRLQTPPKGESRGPARVYVLLANPLQEVRLDAVKNGLTAAVIVRPTSPRRAVPSVTELRYVFDDDAREAAIIAQQLNRLGLPVARIQKTDPGRARPRHFELWLAGDPSSPRAR